MDVETAKALKGKKTQIISTVISPAVRLWLRSQVEQVQALHFKLGGSDRQILTGYIPIVSIAATHAVYQGLHLSSIELEGTDIRYNLGQVFKGKPLRLLAPIPVTGQLLLTESDLQASLQAPLLANALNELLETFLKSKDNTDQVDPLRDRQIHWQEINIDTEQLTLTGIVTDTAIPDTAGEAGGVGGVGGVGGEEVRADPNRMATNQAKNIIIRAGLQLVSNHELELNPLQVDIDQAQPPIDLDGFRIDLGSEVNLEELTLTPGQLTCRGCLKVIP